MKSKPISQIILIAASVLMGIAINILTINKAGILSSGYTILLVILMIVGLVISIVLLNNIEKIVNLALKLRGRIERPDEAIFTHLPRDERIILATDNLYRLDRGDITVAMHIIYSLNMIENARIRADLKEELKQLTRAVDAMIKELPKETAGEVAEDMKLLAEQATSEKPNPKWYNVSIEGLISAAQNLGKVGNEVIELTGKVKKILTRRLSS